MTDKPLLLIGGSGKYGGKLSRLLRRRNPGLPLVLGVRNLEKGRQLADELGNAEVVALDLAEPDFGPVGADYRAAALVGYDPAMAVLQHAAGHGIPYMGIAGGAYELCIDMITALRLGTKAPLVVASHWFAGCVALPAILLARRFASIDTIDIGILIDRGENVGGAGVATVADFKRMSSNCPATVARRSGRYVWLQPEEAKGTFRRGDGVEIEGVGSVSPDVISIGAATGAPDINILEGFAMSAARAAGGPASDEVYIRMRGRAEGGSPLQIVQTITCAREPYSFTAIGAAALIERLAGISGTTTPNGLHMAENIIEADIFVDILREEGAIVSES